MLHFINADMKFYQRFGFLACTLLAITHSVKATSPYTEEIKSPHDLVIEVYERDPMIESVDLVEKVTDEEKKELQKSQENFADSSYSSLIKYNFVFYFIYKHKYENKSQEGLEGLSID